MGERDAASNVGSDDLDLARRFVAGDASAFDAVYRRYVRPVYDYALGMVRDRVLAEDVAQTTFLRAYEQRRSVRDPAAMRAWLYRIAHNVAVNQVIRAVRVDEIPDDTPLPAADAGPEQSAEQREAVRLVWDAAASLEPRQFTVLDLALRKGLSSAEIGDVLDLDAAQASLALHRAREALGNAVRYLLVARRRRDCDRLAELVPAGVRALSPEQRATVDRHMRRCRNCQRMALALTTPGELFGAIPIAVLPAALIEWRRVGRRRASSRGKGVRGIRPRVWIVASAAAGVAALIAAVLVVTSSRHSPRPHPAAASPLTARATVGATGLAALAGRPFAPVPAVAPNTYYSASCPTAAICFAVGKSTAGRPIVSTTTDSGATWRTAYPALRVALGLITCTSASHCIGIQNTGHGDAFVVSDDAGATWLPARAPAVTVLHSASCPTADACLAVGGDLRTGTGEAVTSTDGGHTWHTAVAPGAALSVDCVDASHCWAAGLRAWFTADLGNSWHTMSLPPTFDQAEGEPPAPVTGPGPHLTGLGIVLFGIAFASDTRGIAFGGAQCGGAVTQCASALFRTADGGATWTFWSRRNVTAYGDGSFAACNADACLLVTDTFTRSVLASTIDGTTWTRQQSFPGHVTAIACAPGGELCVIPGPSGLYVDGVR